MKSLQNTDIDVVLIKTSGIALFTVAIAKLPSTIASAFQLIAALGYWTWDSQAEWSGIGRQMNASFASVAAGNLLSFVILLLLARWVFGYPQILRNWLNKSEHKLKD